MSRPARALLGFATILEPILLVVVGVGGYFYVRYAIRMHIRHGVPYLGLSLLLCVILGVGLRVFYGIDVRRNLLVPEDKRRFWQALFFHLNIFVYPFYWYRFIWREGR